MNKQAIIDRTVKAINKLPEEKAREISDFADFITKQYEEQTLTNGIAKLVADSSTFNFLKDEAELYICQKSTDARSLIFIAIAAHPAIAEFGHY